MQNSPRLIHNEKPSFIQLELTYTCNENCLFCYNPARSNKIDIQKIYKLVDAIAHNEIPHIQLTGGEVSVLGVDILNKLIDQLARKSVVSIVTNGIRTLKGLSKNLSAIYVSLHGDEKAHEYLTRNTGGWKKTIKSIEHYIGEGFSVTSDTIMTRVNYKEITHIAEMSKKLGMEQIMVNRFEDGGIGNQNRDILRPSIEQFKEALTLIIDARKKYEIPIGFGTAIPFCLDKRLIAENLATTCGAGIGFCAISPAGEVRICNQSNRVYGNILSESITSIWNKKDLDEFRCLSWVGEPCKSCPALCKCHCGCFVDASQPKEYCIDYAVREQIFEKGARPNNAQLAYPISSSSVQADYGYIPISYPPNHRVFKEAGGVRLEDRFLRVNDRKYPMDEAVDMICRKLFSGEYNERNLINHFCEVAEEKELRKLFSSLVAINALGINGFEEGRDAK